MALAILFKTLSLKSNISYDGAVWFMNLWHASQLEKHTGKKIFGCIYLRPEKYISLLAIQDEIWIYAF